jgi:uncharacterized protein (DUF58 family)
LGIVVAASVATHLIEKRQAVGLATNGRDPLSDATPSFPLRKGREHLMHMLDLLARIEVASETEPLPFLDLVNRESLGLPWGSTVVMVTAKEVENMLGVMLGLRRRGLSIILALLCPGHEFALTVQKADQIGVRALRIGSEQELDAWR